MAVTKVIVIKSIILLIPILCIALTIRYSASRIASPVPVLDAAEARDGDEQPKREQQPILPNNFDNRPVEILATLNTLYATPGDKVRICETVPVTRKIAADGHRHYVSLIADYDKQKHVFISREARFYRLRTAEMDFKNLPENNAFLAGGATYPFTVLNPREQGYEFEIEPLHLGIFQITAVWQTRNDGWIQSQPLILIVRPPNSDDGKPNIKDAWIPK